MRRSYMTTEQVRPRRWVRCCPLPLRSRCLTPPHAESVRTQLNAADTCAL